MRRFLSMLAMLAIFIPLLQAPAAQAWDIIIINDIIKVVTPVSTPTIDTTPSMVISSTKGGTLEYPDECVSDTVNISANQDTTITFNQLDVGVYDSCRIILHYTEWNGYVDFKTATLYVPDFEVETGQIGPLSDITSPTLSEVSEIGSTTDTTPNYTFSSSEVGTIDYLGSCDSSETAAVSGNNTVTFKALTPGTYSNCEITVTDASGNESDSLEVSTFTILSDTTAPTLDMVSPVSTPTTDNTPNLTFSSDEAGTITYSGSCSSDEVDAVDGNNTITLKNLANGTYSNCELRVTDASDNESDWLEIPTFMITDNSQTTSPATTPSSDPDDYCAGYTDVSKTDSDCDAIEYVQDIGAMTGNPNGTFEPNEYLQRDQIAKISLETFDLFSGSKDYCDGKRPFPDVRSSDWSFQYICRGVELAMITGYEAGADAGYYRPARSVNRVEFLALILRNLDDSMPSISSSSYSDVLRGQWYSGYAKYSYDNSLFVGTYLHPDRFVQRVEVARVLYQLHELDKI